MNRNLEELQSELKSEKDSVFIQYTSQYFISSSCNVLQCVVEYVLNHNLVFSLVFLLGVMLSFSCISRNWQMGFYVNAAASEMIDILKL